MADFDRESMLEMFIYEMNQLIESLEGTVLKAESGFERSDINEIFRVMHTIKGSSAMMLLDSISHTAHAIEDMFFYLREENPPNVDSEQIADVVLEGMDFIKGELYKVENGLKVDGVCDPITEKIANVLKSIKGLDDEPKAEEEIEKSSNGRVDFSDFYGNIDEFNDNRDLNNNTYLCNIVLIDDCEMKNIRAYTNINNIQAKFPEATYLPENMLEESSLEVIEKNGYDVRISSNCEMQEVLEVVLNTSYTDHVNFRKIEMGDPNVAVTEFSRFDITVIFADGYGEKCINVIDLLNMFEDSTYYIVCNNIIVEGKSRDEFSFTIYSLLDLKVVEEKVISSNNVIESNVILARKEVSEVIVETENNDKEAETLVEGSKEDSKSTDVVIEPANQTKQHAQKNTQNQVISVSISKLDQLLNLMGELVIAEAMVTQNPELEDLELEGFYKDARQLHKIINDVQDIVMSMRMVPLSSVFFKMHRIVRDMSKQLQKDIELVVIGEETEVDKNIIEHISDPLMHMIRNSADHGIEDTEDERLLAGKPAKGTITLEAKNSGGDVLIIIKDDGKGLDDKKIMAKAKANGMLKKPENEYTQKEIHQFIFQPGFSTNDTVTNYSGRGVGMDVVINNLLSVGGSVEVSSVLGVGSEFTMKIPLTLAIIEGMIISLGGAYYTIPIISIRQQFKAKKEMISVDPSGNEMITTSRGEILNLIRLKDFFGVESEVSDIEDGIVIGIENGNKTLCLHVDGLVGERQVVVKSMPKYIKEIRGISGCTLLGNGDISLIIDVAGFFDK